MKISGRTARLLGIALGAAVLIAIGFGISSASNGFDDASTVAVASDGEGPAAHAGDDDYSLRDVSCGTNFDDGPLATGKVVNISDDNRMFRVVVSFRDGDREVGHGSKLLDELTPGDDAHWAVWGTKRFDGDGLDCDVRVEVT